MASQDIERFVADNVTEAIWLRLRRLTSSRLCEQLLVAQAPAAPADLLHKKSIGMSSAVRSALGYWDTKEGGLNSKILSRYYALLQITFAEQISSLTTDDDLATVQRHTENGHGLFTLPRTNGSFPNEYYVGCLNSGHFAAYARSLGVDLAPYASERRPRKFDAADPSKVIPLGDFLRRVPELQGVIKEYIGLDPLSFQVGHAQKNNIERSQRMRTHAERHGEVLFDPPQEGSSQKTYMAIYHRGASITAEELISFGFEVENIQLEPENSQLHSDEHFVGEVHHPIGSLWWDYVKTYKSGYCGTSIVVPAWSSRDPFILHFVILYAFSIVVRYLPETWYAIEQGKLDNMRALLEHYLVIVDNVLPLLAVERLTKRRLLISQPGSHNAPI